MDIILEKKIILTEILSVETDFILQHVQHKKLITDLDYNALKSLPKNTETMSVEVLDKLRAKGDDACQNFIVLLKQQYVLDQYPRLRDVFSDIRQGEDPEEAASGFSPEAKYAKIVAQGGGHVSAPTVTRSSVQGNIINSHHHYHGPEVSALATPPQDPDHISKIDDYKTSICYTYKQVKEYNSLSGEKVLLADRYTELLIVETHRKQIDREKEISCRGDVHQQVLKTRASEAYNRITVDQLFKPDKDKDVPKAVILQGHSGHGKSFTAQKIMYDWASGKVFKDLFHLVLHLKCKELNEISEAHSLVDLLSYCPSFTKETAEVLKDSKMKVLFLIDGFDELKFSFEKTSTVPLKDPFTKALVEATLSALLKGLVLPKCFLLVTTRSTASDKLSDLLSDIPRFTDILGFTEEGVKEYFQRFFKEELLAKKAFDCVRTNETLYTACSIPVICWITCTVFREQEEKGLDINKELETTTSIFVHFVAILLKHHCQGLSQPAEETLLRSLGQLAERGLQEHQVLFDEKSLSEAFPDPSQANKYNPFLCKFLQRKKVKQEGMYSFMHLSFQEFFAALQYLMLENEEEALKKLRELIGNVERFKPVVQFLFGLSNRDIYPHLKKQSWASIQDHLQKWLLSVLESDQKKRKHQKDMLHLLYCLYELHEEEFVRNAIGVWGKIELHLNGLWSIPLTTTDCWVLLYCLQCCPTIKSLELTGCNITAEKLRMLQPALSRCEELGLTVQRLSDDDVVDLISALGEGKNLTGLSVIYSSLSPESVEQVLSALSRQKSVGDVHLSVMTITVTTAALCLEFIQNTETGRNLTIEDNSSPPFSLTVDKVSRGLRLTVERLSDADVGVLISALGEGKILTYLSVIYSSLSPESVEQVLSALSRQKSVRDVRLSVTTISGTTADLCLDFMENTETCCHLTIEVNSSPPSSSLYVNKVSSGLSLKMHSLSDDDVVDLISALGEGKILTELSVVQSSLSPESVKKVLSALSRQKSLDDIRLSVTKFTGTTADLCLDFIQNTETCRHLRLTDDSSPPSSLSVIKDSSGLRLTVERLSDADVVDLISALGEGKNLTKLRIGDNSCPSSSLSVDKDSRGLRPGVNSLLSSTLLPASITLPQADSPTSGSFTDFIHKFHNVTGLRANPHRSPDDCIGVLESFTDWCTLPGLEKVGLAVRHLTRRWANCILNLIHMCPTLKEVELHASSELNSADGFLLQEGISRLQKSDKCRPDCTVTLIGMRCTKPSGRCNGVKDSHRPCNQRVKIQMRGLNVTQEEI